MTLRDVRRKAAAEVLFAGFHLMNTLNNSMLTFNRNDWGAKDKLFTEAEIKYLEKIRKRNHESGEALRKLGWSLRRQ
jgi:hypothetical protein